MIERIQRFFETRLAAPQKTEHNEQQHQLATAALLVELSRADYKTEPAEQAAIVAATKRAFGLSDEATKELVELAETEADASTSLYEFTRLINDNFDEAEKEHIVELLWEVAYADGDLDKYEEHLIRRIADLIHVRHKAFVKLKHKVQTRR